MDLYEILESSTTLWIAYGLTTKHDIWGLEHDCYSYQTLDHVVLFLAKAWWKMASCYLYLDEEYDLIGTFIVVLHKFVSQPLVPIGDVREGLITQQE